MKTPYFINDLKQNKQGNLLWANRIAYFVTTLVKFMIHLSVALAGRFMLLDTFLGNIISGVPGPLSRLGQLFSTF